jgi:uncharacterized protein
LGDYEEEDPRRPLVQGLQLTRVFLDTSVIVHATGATHPLREPCREIVRLSGEGRLTAETSVETVQELVHVLLRRHRNRPAAVAQAQAVGRLCEVHDFVRADLDDAMTLYREHPALDMRDAVYAATALNRGLRHLISTDRAFQGVPGLAWVDPADREAVAVLLA